MSAKGYITGHQHRSKATIDINRRTGSGSEVIASVLITPRSLHRFSLMQEDYIQLEFSLVEPINFAIGDYIHDPIFGYYYITSEQMPRHQATTGGFDYSLRFDAEYFVFANNIHTLTIIKNPNVEAIVESTQSEQDYSVPTQNAVITIATASSEDGVFERKEAKWSLTDKLLVQAEQVICNIKAIYHGLDYIVAIHTSATKAAEVKCMTYEGCSIIAALNDIAQKWECEWWITHESVTESGSTHLRHTIHFGKCELNNTPFVFAVGDNVETMDFSRDQQTFANRIYPYGGTRNIPPSYRKELVFEVTEAANGKYRDATRDITLDMIAGVVTQQDFVFGNAQVETDTTSGKKITIRWISLPITALRAGDQIRGNLNLSVLINLSSNVTATILVTRKYQGQTKHTYVNNSISLQSPQLTREIAIDETLGAQFEYNYIEVAVMLSSSNASLNVSNYSLNSTLEALFNGVSAQISLKYNGNNYPITFNADEDDNDSIGARYFTFNDSSPAGFGVGSKYTLTGLDALNVPPSYYYTPKYDSGVLRKIGDRRLCIPESYNGKQYIEAQGLNHYTKVVEEVVVFDDIYPKMSLKVASVETEIKKIDGQGRVIYSFTAKKSDNSAFTFNTRYLMDGELQAVFTAPTSAQSNGYKLSGMTFDVSFENRTQKFTIETNEDYGVRLPNSLIYPSVGDTFILTGWNPNAMSSLSLISDAEGELLTKAKEYLAAIQEGQFTFTCRMMSDIFWRYDYGGRDASGSTPKTYGLLALGARVTISNDALPGGSKTSRIIGYEYKLDIPYDTPTYIIGETEAFSRIKQIEKRLTKL